MMFRSLLFLGSMAAGSASAVEIKPYAYLQYDINRIEENDRLTQDGDIRRLRAGVNVRLTERLDTRVEYDFYSELFTDVFLRYRHNGHSVRAGHIKPPFSLEQLSSNRNALFVERSLADGLSLARRRGVEYGYAFGKWRVQAGTYDGNSAGLLEGNGWVGRAVFAPKIENGTLHFALAAGVEHPDVDFRLSSRGETGPFSPTRIDTGRLRDVDKVGRVGVEALWLTGPFAVQAEWMSADIDRVAKDARVDGGYLQASWMLTGNRTYKDGILDAPNVGEGRTVELAARISRLDLSDASVAGGTLDNLTLGATWYFTAATRVMFNYIRSDGERSVPIDRDIIEARLQVSL